MARQTLSPITPKGPHPDLPVAADALDITFTTCDPVNFDEFAMTGRDLLLVKNAHASTAKYFTLESIADDKKRTGDVTQYSLGAGEIAAFYFGRMDGWAQSTGKMNLKGESTDIKFSVLRLVG